jgi:hypothetical protein
MVEKGKLQKRSASKTIITGSFGPRNAKKSAVLNLTAIATKDTKVDEGTIYESIPS